MTSHSMITPDPPVAAEQEQATKSGVYAGFSDNGARNDE